MKISVFAAVSLRERSASTARARPNTVARPVTATTHQRLFQMMPRSVEKIAISMAIAATTMRSVDDGAEKSGRAPDPCSRRAVYHAARTAITTRAIAPKNSQLVKMFS